MAKNKNRQRKTTQPVTPATEKIPLVSVIIPVFNAEKFLPQTLESLLYQTMTDFEVIAVDDCSTDNSIAVLESFVPKLLREGVKLHVVKLATNIGTPAVPRNIGINFARGKYIAFLDSDDLYTKSALEELSTLAEEFQADIINATDFFCFKETQANATTAELLTMNHRVITCRKPGAPKVNLVGIVPEDMVERAKLWLNDDIHWATCATFCRRDFLTVNDIRFPVMKISEDQIFNFACLCRAKKYLHSPNVTYICRERADSLSRAYEDSDKYFHKWLSNLTIGFREFAAFMDGLDFFREHVDYRCAVLDWYFNRMIKDARQLSAAYAQVHPALLNQFVEKEFSSDDAALTAYLFNVVNLQRLELAQKFHKQ